MKKIIKALQSYTLIGSLRYLFMKLRGKEAFIGGNCHCCGRCCKKLSLDDGKGWIRSFDDFQSIVNDNPDYSCFKIVGCDDFGILQLQCSHLDGNGTCSIYERRFSFCRDFPDKNLIFCGGGLPEGCGYTIRTVTPFSKVLEKSLDQSK